MPCDPKTYPFTPDIAAKAAAALKDAGYDFDPSAASGQFSAHGVTAGYEVKDEKITISILKKSALLPCGVIFGQLDKHLTS